MHDFGFENNFEYSGIDHYNLNEIEDELIDTLFIVKSAIIYFVEAIHFQSNIIKEEKGGMFGTLYVPSHKEIRGETNGKRKTINIQRQHASQTRRRRKIPTKLL